MFIHNLYPYNIERSMATVCDVCFKRINQPQTATYILPAAQHDWKYGVWAVIGLREMSTFHAYKVNHFRILLAQKWHLSTHEHLPHQHTYSNEPHVWASRPGSESGWEKYGERVIFFSLWLRDKFWKNIITTIRSKTLSSAHGFKLKLQNLGSKVINDVFCLMHST